MKQDHTVVGEGIAAKRVDRRGLLRLGGLAAAGAAAITALKASPAGAGTDGDVVLGAANDAGTGDTVLQSTADYQTLSVANFANGAAIGARGSHGYGVYAEASGANAAIFARNDAGYAPTSPPWTGGPAVHAQQQAISINYTTGPAILAEMQDIGLGTPLTDAVVISNEGSGHGLDVSDRGADGAIGTGSAINAHLDNDINPSDVVIISTAGFGTGLRVSAPWGSGIVASTSGMVLPTPTIEAVSSGKGAAVAATTSSNAIAAAVQATSGSAQPAVRATGIPIDPSDGVGAGNAAALDVRGSATFARSNVAAVGPNMSYTITDLVPGGLDSRSHVLATVQSQYAQDIAIKSAVPILTGTQKGRIRINLTAPNNTGAVIRVAWFVFG